VVHSCARDEKDKNGGDRHPGPVRQAGPFVDRAQFFTDEKRRRAEQEAEHGRAAQRDPDADHGRAAHRLHDKDAQNPVDEIKETRQVLRHRGLAEQARGQRGLLRDFGDEVGRQAYEAAPDHPADPLVVARRQIPATADQNPERGGADRKTDEDRGPHGELGRVAEGGSETHERDGQEQDGERRQRALDPTPPPLATMTGARSAKSKSPV